jgi:hypothetical protein
MNNRRFVFGLFSVILCVSVSVPVAPQTQQMPQPSPELVALSRIPLFEVTVTDPDGNKLPGAFVNYRGLMSGLTGGGITGATGRFVLNGLLGGTVTSGWRLTGVGPHRLEVGIKGFRTWISDPIDLVAGQTRSLTVVLERQGAAQLKDALSYRRDAETHVVQAMSTRGDALGEARSVGEPVLLPIVARTMMTRDSRVLPEAFVETATYVNGAFREPAVVVFQEGRPDARFSYSSSSGFLPLEEQEWRELSAALASFFDVAADVTRGAERFNVYLPDDMRAMFNLRAEKNRLFLRPEAVGKLTNDELRRFTALTLDALSLRAWMILNGIAPSDPWRPADVRQDPERVIKSLDRLCNDERDKLKKAGALSPERVASGRAYVRRMLGEGYLVREDPARDGIQLSGRDRMYATALAGIFPHIVLRNGSVRIVAVDLP